MTTTPRMLVWATDIDVLPADRVVERRADHLVVRSPGNPGHYWGNFLVFDSAPEPGDVEEWERRFKEAFEATAEVRHVAMGWDVEEPGHGPAIDAFERAGYLIERTVGLIASPDEIRPHPRASAEVAVRVLDPHGDEPAWRQVVEVQVAGRDEHHPEAVYRDFVRRRQAEHRAFFAAGRGAWFVAELSSGEVAGSCGVVVTDGRGRFQVVDTAEAHRRRGISSRLVVEAAHRAAERFGAQRLVIAADPDYHALALYESLGFTRAEQVCGVVRLPPDP